MRKSGPFRTHPDQEMWLETTLIDLSEERCHYLVLPEIASALSIEVTAKILVPTINRHGALMLWPIRDRQSAP